MVILKPMTASATSREMVFSSDGKKQSALKNVVVGEVWLAGGQSNMATTLQNYRRTTQKDIESADDPLLRMVTIPRLDYKGQSTDQPRWQTTSRESAAGFSATAYYFAKDLREKLKVPVGIIACSVGASPAEAWMSRETLSATPSLQRVLDSYDAYLRKKFPNPEDYFVLAKEQERQRQAWYESKRQGGTPAGPNAPEISMGPYSFKRPCGLHETMLAQTIPYTLRGVIWYQGENNANAQAGFHYREVFPALIKQWRTDFMQRDLPFLFVQLATFGPIKDATAGWPELRDSQQWTEANVENTGMAVLVDGGELAVIHPHSKHKAGLRLSLLARHMAYGETGLVCRGPRMTNASPKAGQIELDFANVGAGLVLRDSKGTPFEICGEDGKYVPAQAKLEDGGKISVWTEGVERPRHVRYGWKKWFEPTLFNQEGLPAAPFKSDDFKPQTEGRFYLDRL
jgi:sialate O-acetylesterase